MANQVVTQEHTDDLHNGNRFKSSYRVPHGSELANDAALDILIKVGSNCIHPRIRGDVAASSDLDIYEGTTVSANGTALAVIAKNRCKSFTPTTNCYHGPTVTDVGTKILEWFIGAGAKVGAAGAGFGEEEWVLEASTNYLVRITNRSGAAVQVAVSVGWAEELR